MIALINFLFIIVSSLISVAFYTILERKLLSYLQIRKGPNKVGISGILQPFSDAIKLFSKNMNSLENSNLIFMFLSPISSFILSLLIWPIIPCSNFGMSDFNFNLIMFFIISSISVYSLIMIGWSANSKYCYLGSIRSLAQMISYEVSLFLILISISLLCYSYNISSFYFFQMIIPFCVLSLPSLFMWMITCLAETNRSPFDFAEGESELVSGFNVEFLGGYFALIFLAEYLSMILLSLLSSFFFFYSNIYSVMIMALSLSIMFIWIRGTLPRFRYDLLMMLNWKIFLPSSIALSTLFLSLALLKIF